MSLGETCDLKGRDMVTDMVADVDVAKLLRLWQH